MPQLNLFIPITKVDAAKRLVYGVLTEEVPDKAGEIFDYETGKEAFKAWSAEIEKSTDGKSKGNLRAMHDKVAAGKFTDIVFDDAAKRVEGVAKVVDDNEWNKVLEGVYTGFSIGGGYAKRWPDPNNPQLKRYTPTLSEVSLVDNPCVPTATFEFIKEDGSTELRKFTAKQEATMTENTETTTPGDTAEAIEKATPAPAEPGDEAGDPAPTVEKADRPQDKGGVVQGFQARDGSFHLKKADALKRNSELDAEEAVAPALEALQKLSDAVAKADEPPATADEVAKADGNDPTTAPAAPADAPASEEAAEPVEKADAPADEPPAQEMKKGMYGVSRFAELLQSIQSLQADTQWEAEWEGDDSTLPAKLKAWLAEGGKLLVQMTREETAELTATKAAGGDPEGALSKREDDALRIENAALKKAFGEMTPKLEGLLLKFEEQSKRIAHLESQPAAPKGALRVVEKASDGGNDSDGDIVTKFNKHLDALTPEARSKELMKLALANPVPVAR